MKICRLMEKIVMKPGLFFAAALIGIMAAERAADPSGVVAADIDIQPCVRFGQVDTGDLPRGDKPQG